MAENDPTQPLNELMKQMTSRHIRNGLKSALRREAKRGAEIAQKRLMSVGPNVQGNKRDWKRGIRPHVYSRGGGFLVSVKARSSRSGKEQGMHENRRGLKKPILMWMEDGTKVRQTRSSTSRSFKRRASHGTGRIYAYNILKNSEGEILRSTETNLYKDVEESVRKVAKKAGLE